MPVLTLFIPLCSNCYCSHSHSHLPFVNSSTSTIVSASLTSISPPNLEFSKKKTQLPLERSTGAKSTAPCFPGATRLHQVEVLRMMGRSGQEGLLPQRDWDSGNQRMFFQETVVQRKRHHLDMGGYRNNDSLLDPLRRKTLGAVLY